MFGNYFNRSASSKSISTSTTLRTRSPSIKLQEPPSPKTFSPSPQPSFIDHNLDFLNNLKHLLTKEDNMVEFHRKWCQDMNSKVQKVFNCASTQITALLSEQELKMKNTIHNDFIRFLNFLKSVKNEMNALYRAKQQLNSQKIVNLEKKFVYQTNQYYVSQNLEARNQYDLQNQQRCHFRGHNDFYRCHQQNLRQLSLKAEEQLSLKEKLQEKEEYLEFVLTKFKDNFDHYCSLTKESWQAVL